MWRSGVELNLGMSFRPTRTFGEYLIGALWMENDGAAYDVTNSFSPSVSVRSNVLAQAEYSGHKIERAVQNMEGLRN